MSMVTARRKRIDLDAVRAALTEMCGGLRDLTAEVEADHKKLAVCSNFAQYQKDLPAAWLQRAGDRLKKTDYKIAFVGPYKAGKSTFLSALFRQPGMLPAQDAECTFAVSVVTSPGPGQMEQVKVTYYTSEEALRNILANTAFTGLFDEKRGERDEILRNFAADRAIEFIREGAEKHKVGSLQNEAGQILHFLQCYREFRDRLGKTHIDSIDRLDTYVRKPDDVRIGHLLLIKIVEIFRHNDVLRQNCFQIADTPGIDSLNQAAREITFNYLKEADAVVYVAQARGLAQDFQKVREHLMRFQNDIREKMFVVANQADWYDAKSMKRQHGEKPQIEVIFENIVNPLLAFNVNEDRLYFTCGRVAELLVKRELGNLTADEDLKFKELRRGLDESKAALDPAINPVLHRLLTDCFEDGGVSFFRQALLGYLQYDIQVERLKEVFLDLDRAYGALNRLLEPEQARLKDILASLKPRSQQITEFFEQAKNRFLDKISVLNTGAPRAVEALASNAREQIESSIAASIERLNIDRVRTRVKVSTQLNVKMEVINYFKVDLSAKFSQVLRDAISPVFRAKLLDQVNESRVRETLAHLAKGFGADFDAKFDALIDGLCGMLDRLTTMRAREETWDLIDMEMKPSSFGVEWNEKVETEFRADLKRVFTEYLTERSRKLSGILARHYQDLVQDLARDLEKLLDEVSATIKKDPDRVALPVKLLTGDEQETDDERKQRCLLSYFRQQGTVRKSREDAAPNFAGSQAP